MSKLKDTTLADSGITAGAGFLSSMFLPGIPAHTFVAARIAPKGKRKRAAAGTAVGSTIGALPGLGYVAHTTAKTHGGYGSLGRSVKKFFSNPATSKYQKVKSIFSGIRKNKRVLGKGWLAASLGAGVGSGAGYYYGVKGKFKKQAELDANPKHYGQFLADLAKHKYSVIQAGIKINAPIGVLVKHDISKLRPSELGPYTKWFFGPKGRQGTRDPEMREKWRQSVQKHYARNLHHATRLGLKKPLANELESLADWYSAAKRASGYRSDFPTFRQWYSQNKHWFPISSEAILHSDTHLAKNAMASSLRNITKEKIIMNKAEKVFYKYAAEKKPMSDLQIGSLLLASYAGIGASAYGGTKLLRRLKLRKGLKGHVTELGKWLKDEGIDSTMYKGPK